MTVRPFWLTLFPLIPTFLGNPRTLLSQRLNMGPAYCIILMAAVRVWPASEAVDVTIATGFIIEDHAQRYRVMDAAVEPSMGVVGKVVLFPQGRQSLLYQAAKHVNSTGVDITIGYGSYNSVHQLHRLFSPDSCRRQADREVVCMGDMFWFLNLQSVTPDSYCVRDTQMIQPADCESILVTAKAIATVVIQLRWRYLTILYHPTHERISTLTINLLSEQGIGIYQYRVSDDGGLRLTINKSTSTTVDQNMNYISFANQMFTETILETLYLFDNEVGGTSATTSFSRWIMWGADLDMVKLAGNLKNLNNVAILYKEPCTRSKYSSLSIELLPATVLNSGLSEATKISLNSSCTSLSEAQRNITKLYLAIQKTLSCGEFRLNPKFSVYTALWKTSGRRFERVLGPVTRWKINISDESVFPNAGFGLNNISLIITTLPWPPYVYKNVVDGKTEYTGFCVDLIQELGYKLNFSYKIVEPDDHEWGRILDGRWTGLVGQMQRREADLTVAALSVQPEREEVMDFISPYYTEYTMIILKKPHENSSKWKTLIDPFHWLVIVGIIVSVPLVTFFLSLCEKVSPYYAGIQNRNKYPGLHHYSDCFWYLLGALLTQGGVYLPKSQSSRTITSFWWLFSIIVVATYSGNLIASLTVTRDLIPFNSVKELVRQSTYKWGTTNGTYLNMMLQNSRDPIYRELWAGIKRFEVEDPDVLNPNHTVQVQRVKKGQYAYLNDASSMNSEILTDCSLALVDEEFLPLHFAIGLQQGSPYRSVMDDQMLAISESGLLSIWKRKWWLRNSTCVGLLIRQAKPISLLDVQSAYYVLVIGIAVAGFTTFTEFMRKFLCKRKLQQHVHG